MPPIQVGDVLVVDCFRFSFQETSDPFPGQYTIQSDHLFEEPYQLSFPHEFLIIVEIHAFI